MRACVHELMDGWIDRWIDHWMDTFCGSCLMVRYVLGPFGACTFAQFRMHWALRWVCKHIHTLNRLNPTVRL